MFIERIRLTNFRCFGEEQCEIFLQRDLTALVGGNGTGKTAVLLALQRLFGVTGEQRRLRRQDFHVPVVQQGVVDQRSLVIEAIIAFPELDGGGDMGSVAEFFHQMAADENGHLKCRLRLEATWIDDSTQEGAIESKFWAIRTFGHFEEANCIELKTIDRARIQLIYVPANRDGASQVAAFLRGRLWRAINWSKHVKDVLTDAGAAMNDAFAGERAVQRITAAITARWLQVHSADTDTTPLFRPIDMRWQEFIRKVEVVFHPDEAGRERNLDELSDGQRSLFHLAMTAATLDVEGQVLKNPVTAGFLTAGVPLPALTLIAIEEPENTLAPFYLSRIIGQIQELTHGCRAQAVLSSHSASILARIDPVGVRHFRLDPARRTAKVRSIRLPTGLEDASKFVREAVRTYPELYFARFVVLGEGASEEVVLPRLAEAMGFPIDRSFVAIVPLGGRHVNHLWRLLTDLDIPHATLLDLDWGRNGGGWGRIKNACAKLVEIGVPLQDLIGTTAQGNLPVANLAALDTYAPANTDQWNQWLTRLQRFNIFFCTPLDLDFSMLRAFLTAYQVREAGQQGPSDRGNPRDAVLGEDGSPDFYGVEYEVVLRWYRYLFLGRGKPSTHVRVLSHIPLAELAANAPPELRALIAHVRARLEPVTPPVG